MSQETQNTEYNAILKTRSQKPKSANDRRLVYVYDDLEFKNNVVNLLKSLTSEKLNQGDEFLLMGA